MTYDLPTGAFFDQLNLDTSQTRGRSWGEGGYLVASMPVCVCPKVKDMGPFSASSEWNEQEDVIQNGCEICCSSLYG